MGRSHAGGVCLLAMHHLILSDAHHYHDPEPLASEAGFESVNTAAARRRALMLEEGEPEGGAGGDGQQHASFDLNNAIQVPARHTGAAGRGRRQQSSHGMGAWRLTGPGVG